MENEAVPYNDMVLVMEHAQRGTLVQELRRQMGRLGEAAAVTQVSVFVCMCTGWASVG